MTYSHTTEAQKNTSNAEPINTSARLFEVENRSQIHAFTHISESEALQRLAASYTPDDNVRQQSIALAKSTTKACRGEPKAASQVDALLQEFSLDTHEGISLMCLAEALLRIPDNTTADKLISDTLSQTTWLDSSGENSGSDKPKPSLFVNASRWSLALTGKVLDTDGVSHNQLGYWAKTLQKKLSQPVIRTAVRRAMSLVAKHYVVGETIDQAHKQAGKYKHSFDMLGEAARSDHQAEIYFQAYLNAIKTIDKKNKAAEKKLPHSNESQHSVSIKLSALHPRFEFSQQEAVHRELFPRLITLALAAKDADIQLTIDAEEANRLDIGLQLLEELAAHPHLQGWDGLGLAIQAYQKRAPAVIHWVVQLAKRHHRRMHIRLVKGAYWDSEIQHAQKDGHQDYPVYTLKIHTDLSYLVCAQLLLKNTETIYPQFATHNAHTIAFVLNLANEFNIDESAFEFQRLHGMGDNLYQELSLKDRVRVYAPVGHHKDLLPYLVRRLLENGANNSFVHHFLNPDFSLDELIQDPWSHIDWNKADLHNPFIPRPMDIFQHSAQPTPQPRKNAKGTDLSHPEEQAEFLSHLIPAKEWRAAPIINGKALFNTKKQTVISPIDGQTIGFVTEASIEDIDNAAKSAKKYWRKWDQLGGEKRAELLEAYADLLEQQEGKLINLIVQEAGRTLNDAIDEVREAVDFCRYYACLARQQYGEGERLVGPTGETNLLYRRGRGTFVCISPWNFPLAIFVGQIVAALAAGNCVLAKPAPQTPIIAHLAIELCHQAGIPSEAVHLLPGEGNVGEAMIDHPLIDGVAFTGSCQTAKRIHLQLAQRPGAILPLIAETGGLNTLIADSSALPEQLADDVLRSAFTSAGQRCSALRVLYIQSDIADDVITLIKDAMQTLQVGDPLLLKTDIGPVIDQNALSKLKQHLGDVTAKHLGSAPFSPSQRLQQGSFLSPQLLEIESLNQLSEEVFGPILHVIRFDANHIEHILDDINASQFGLTMGIHSRLDTFCDYVSERVQVGNVYINRDIIGAAVGINPFGGCGKSGTGPKAGGPNYLIAFGKEHTRTENITAKGGNMALFNLPCA